MPPATKAVKTVAKKVTAKRSAPKKKAAPPGEEFDATKAPGFVPDRTRKITGPSPRRSFAASNPGRLVLVEFLVCFVILGLGTIVAPPDEKNGGAGHLAVKGSALALLFFILALLSAGGPKAKRGAGALGGLVTAAYVFTSRESANLVTWSAGFFTAPAAPAASGATGPAEAGGAGGAVTTGLAGAAQ